MSTKTTFKRIALVAVAALGLGVLSVAPSSAATTVIDETLTLSASSATIAIGDTATVTITNTFTNTVASETSTIVVTGAGAAANSSVADPTGAAVFGLKADSANATLSTTESAVITSRGDTITVQAPASVGNYVKATYRLDIRNVTTAGTWTYTVYTKGIQNTLNKSATFTLTVSAKDLDPVATKSLMYINAAAALCASTTCDIIEADSAIVTTAGTVAGAGVTQVGFVAVINKNLSDTKTVTGTAVSGDVTVSISGPGFLSDRGAPTLRAKSVVLTGTETAVIYSDGTAGTGTITAYVGATAFTQAAKTVKFNGAATTFTTTQVAAVKAGGNLGYTDSATAGTAIITFLATDSAGNAVSSAALNTGGTSAFYALSSDTYVVRATGSSLSAALACSYTSITVGWTCNGNVIDSGTVTLTIADSTTTNAPTKSTAVSYTVVGAARTGTISFDKATYTPGEKATITITSKDRAGRNVPNGASNPFSLIVQNKAFSSVATGYGFGAGQTGTSWDLASTTFVNGVETFVVYMPVTGGDVTLTGYTEYDSSTVNTPVSVSVAVVDAQAAAAAAAAAANAAAAAAATAAAKDASDAATDAALEATDAAYAATDAANIAAEAADAATAAAEAATEAANAAKESADAATAAVEELATSVAKLMAALQAQITTLAKVVAKIAVKVKA